MLFIINTKKIIKSFLFLNKQQQKTLKKLN